MFLTDNLLMDIKKGGCIFCPRQSGKTTAIMEFMRKEKDYIVSTFSHSLVETYKREYPELKSRIFGPAKDIASFKGKGKLIIDEAFLNNSFHMGIPYHAALATAPCNMTVYAKNGDRLELESESDAYSKKCTANRYSIILKNKKVKKRTEKWI